MAVSFSLDRSNRTSTINESFTIPFTKRITSYRRRNRLNEDYKGYKYILIPEQNQRRLIEQGNRIANQKQVDNQEVFDFIGDLANNLEEAFKKLNHLATATSKQRAKDRFVRNEPMGSKGASIALLASSETLYQVFHEILNPKVVDKVKALQILSKNVAQIDFWFTLARNTSIVHNKRINEPKAVVALTDTIDHIASFLRQARSTVTYQQDLGRPYKNVYDDDASYNRKISEVLSCPGFKYLVSLV